MYAEFSMIYLMQVVNERPVWRQFDDHHHRLREHDAVKTYQVLVVERVHALDLLDKVLKRAGLGQSVLKVTKRFWSNIGSDFDVVLLRTKSES